MTPISFPEANATYGEGQPQYLPLPALRERDGCVTTCWKLTRRERVRLLFTGRIWWRVLTFNRPLQPVLPTVEKPAFVVPPPDFDRSMWAVGEQPL